MRDKGCGMEHEKAYSSLGRKPGDFLATTNAHIGAGEPAGPASQTEERRQLNNVGSQDAKGQWTGI